MRHKINSVGLILALLVLFGSFSGSWAYTATPPTSSIIPAAAPLTVLYDGVEMRRANTEQWLTLPRHAVAPVGIGDTLRTNGQGRVWIDVLGAYEILLLPNSLLTITALSYDVTAPDDITLAATLDGHMIQRTLHKGDYALEFAQGVMTQPAELMAIWSNFEQSPVVSVVEGVAEVVYPATALDASDDATQDADDETLWSVDEGNSFYLETDGKPVIVTPKPPLNAAHVLGQMWGCTGQVIVHRTVERLNVRVGPGLGYSIIGYINDNSTAQIMGVTENNGWYRVQRLSGFGWVEGLAVEADCPELPVYPRVFLEQNAEIFEPQPEEITLLSPFYNDPTANLWFYRNAGYWRSDN